MGSPDRRGARAACTITALALVSCNGGPGDASPPDPPTRGEPTTAWFVEEAARRGLRFDHVSGVGDRLLFPEISCGGAALLDVDGDDDLDAYLVQGGRITVPPADRPPNRLFRNDGGGTFTDITEGSGADDRGYGMGAATGDYDNDGDLDLYVTNVGQNTLLRNEGAGVFTDVTAETGTGHAGWGAGAAFLDYDRDGDLDLFVVNYIHWTVATERDCFATTGERDYCAPSSYQAPAEDVLYRNEGDGTFTDVSETAGIRAAFGNGLGVVCGDLDGNGWIDVFVANDGMKNQMWLNQGDGTFIDRALLAGTALDTDGIAKAGMGVCAADVDDDADLDLLVVNLVQESDSFYRNEGTYFKDDTTAVGLRGVTRLFTRFGMALVDLNDDGRLDVYQANGRVRRQSQHHGDDPFAEPNLVLRGTPNGRFEEVTPRGGTDPLLVATSRAAAFGDVDGDGGVDILVVNRDGPAHLLLNRVPDRGGWIDVRVLDEHGRDAIGATVSLQLGERTITRDVRTAYSYCAANDPTVHVGLGDRQDVDAISVRWPDGSVERFDGHAANRRVVLRRGTGRAS